MGGGDLVVCCVVVVVVYFGLFCQFIIVDYVVKCGFVDEVVFVII